MKSEAKKWLERDNILCCNCNDAQRAIKKEQEHVMTDDNPDDKIKYTRSEKLDVSATTVQKRVTKKHNDDKCFTQSCYKYI